MLFDVLMEGLDPDPLKIKLDHLSLGRGQVVGNKESGAVLCLGDKKKHDPDFGQIDEELGHPKPFPLGSADGFVM